MSLLGGTVTAGWIHRFGAVITFAYFGIHIVDLTRRFLKSGQSLYQYFLGPNTMIPTWRDVTDFAATMRWFLGLGPRPRYGKWTYWEKFDYFAVFWGVFVIGLSGLVLWFPVQATWLLPGWAINVATIIHSEEALLATGFIFSIHFFNTHLRPEKFPMDKVVFTGTMSLEELKTDKPELYERLVASGELEEHLVEPPTPEVKRRAYVFGFLALGVGVALLVLLLHGLVTVGL
jgi:cytochrome b subunit of formate dehydrogenase